MKAITPELVRAESALLRQDKAWTESVKAHSARWSAKKDELIASFDPEVREALVALRVITVDDVQSAQAWKLDH